MDYLITIMMLSLTSIHRQVERELGILPGRVSKAQYYISFLSGICNIAQGGHPLHAPVDQKWIAS